MNKTPDFGPVPVSRLKDEAQQVYRALEEGRRVLVSRHGQVVAGIEPASVPRHSHLLASFALGRPIVSELTATEISQGSPSEAIRRAEEGESILLTRQNKVFGVLGAPTSPETVESAQAQERLLSAFEAANPDATPEDFARASRDASVMVQAALPEPGHELTSELVESASPLEASITATATAVLVDAYLVEGRAYGASANLSAAESAFQSGIRFREYPDFRVQSRVAESMVELAKVYTQKGRTAEAVHWAKDAVNLLKPYAADHSPSVGVVVACLDPTDPGARTEREATD